MFIRCMSNELIPSPIFQLVLIPSVFFSELFFVFQHFEFKIKGSVGDKREQKSLLQRDVPDKMSLQDRNFCVEQFVIKALPIQGFKQDLEAEVLDNSFVNLRAKASFRWQVT